MCNLWRAVEALGDSAAVPVTWRKLLGPDLAVAREVYLRKVDREARTYPCEFGCGCRHEIVRHANGEIVAVCVCEDEDCDLIELTEEDTVLLEMNLGKLGRAVGASLCGAGRDVDLGVPGTWQVGAAAKGTVPVVMGLAESDGRFRAMVAELVARLRKPFVLVTPTSRSLDGNTQTLLTSGQADFLDLQSHLTMSADGSLVASEAARAVLARLEQPAMVNIPVQVARDEPQSQFVFRKAGSVWAVVFDGGPEFHIEDTMGAKYLNHLLHHPNKAMKAFELELAIRPDKAEVREQNSVQKTADDRARREAREELRELLLELEEAEAGGNVATVQRLTEEIAGVKAMVGNHSLLDADTGEKARDNVRKAINKVVKNLRKGGKDEQAFGQHIVRFVSLGYEVVYHQTEEEIWG